MDHNSSSDSVPPKRTVCAGTNCNFYGDAVSGLCSKCSRDKIQLEQQAAIKPTEKETPQNAPVTIEVNLPPAISTTAVVEKKETTADDAQRPKQPEGRCFTCNKKIGLLGFKCRCEYSFCSTHRYNDAHNCTFDYKSAGRELLSKNNPLIAHSKIQKI